jgi:hypothetical protein
VDDSGLEEAVDLIRALGEAKGARALNAALSRVVAGIYARISDGKLRAEFEIAADLPPDHTAAMHVFRHAKPVGLDAMRITFPDPGETRAHTLV